MQKSWSWRRDHEPGSELETRTLGVALPAATMIVVAALVGRATAADDLTTAPSVLVCAKKVYEQGQFAGLLNGEAGASVYRDASGADRCHAITLSMAGGAVDIRLHRDAVAVLHTHPPKTQEWPSRNDAALAKRLGVPVYTLQPCGIWRVDPQGRITREAGRGWQRAKKRARVPQMRAASDAP